MFIADGSFSQSVPSPVGCDRKSTEQYAHTKPNTRSPPGFSPGGVHLFKNAVSSLTLIGTRDGVTAPEPDDLRGLVISGKVN